MRKANQEITDPKVKEGILAQSNICRIAMNDAEAPYILPFNYGYRDNCIYIHSAAEGKKIDLIKNNSKVCFEIEEEAEIVKHEKACNWATTYKSIVGYGKMNIINDYDEKFNLHKVEAGVATENHRSIRVLEKAGMTREGLRRKILPIRGEWKDNYHYAIVEGKKFEKNFL